MAGQVVYTKEPPFNDVLRSSRTTGTSGVPNQLSPTSIPIIEVAIQPLLTNTGDIWIGGSNVVGTGANGGVVLVAPAAGAQPASITISAKNAQDIYFSPEINNEGITFVYW